MTALLMSIFISKNSSILFLLHLIGNHLWFSIFPDLPSHWGLSSKQIQDHQVDFWFPPVFGVLPRLLGQKLSPPWGWGRWDLCWSGRWHIFQVSLSLVRHLSTLEQTNSKKKQNKKHFVFLVCFFFTWDDNMLWVSSGSLKSSKQGASWKLLLGRSWQLVGDAHLHLLRSLPPFSAPVENINPLNIHSLSVVDGQPWVRFFFRVAERKLFASLVRSYVAIDAPGGKNFVSKPRSPGYKGVAYLAGSKRGSWRWMDDWVAVTGVRNSPPVDLGICRVESVPSWRKAYQSFRNHCFQILQFYVVSSQN